MAPLYLARRTARSNAKPMATVPVGFTTNGLERTLLHPSTADHAIGQHRLLSQTLIDGDWR